MIAPIGSQSIGGLEEFVLRSIDHIVIVARDLAEAVANYERAGFTVTPGGEHVGGATHNALISLADGTYVELIAFREPDRPQPHRWWGRLTRGEGLVDYALLSDDLTGEARRAEASGLRLRGPVDGGRQRPDGIKLIWRSFFFESAPGETALPFVIQDVTARTLRVPGDTTRHRLSVSRVAGLSLLTADLDQARRELGLLLGDPGRPGRPIEAGRTYRFALGAQWLELIQPTDPTSPEAERLRRLGEGPDEVVFAGTGSAEPGQGDLLEGYLNGARIRVAG